MPDDISQDIAIKGEGNIVVGKGDVIINPLPPAEARLRHDLGILLKNIETTWIKGVLEKSVHEAALLELGMEIRVEAVDNPWRMVLEGPDQSREVLPRGRKIKDIFNEANHLLLILGEPGSGKTTTLLQLARDLVAEVDQAFTEPIPVILNLSTWTNKKQPLDEWLVAELNSKYRLPKKDGKSWLKERRILPLLDGLDEVKAENRAPCVEKINQLVSDYGLQGMVVCSRIKDYADLNVRLAFYRAIYLQPLTNDQIDEYLNQAGDKLTSLRATLQSDDALQSLAQSPLILNIMSLAYQNASAETLSNPAFGTNETRRKHLFDMYIARMFNRKGGGQAAYDSEQTKQRLSWLARNMQRHNQEVFLIEDLQPSWLQTRHWQWVYFLASRLVSGLIFGLSLGIGIIDIWSSAILTIAPITGLSIGFIDVLRFEWLRKRRMTRKHFAFSLSLINIMVVFLVVVVISGVGYWLYDGSGDQSLFSGLIFGVSFGLIFGLRGSRQSQEIDVQTVEALQWSWRKAAVGGLIGETVWLLIGLIGMGRGFMRLDAVLVTGVYFALIGAILNGFYREIIETKSRPNEGIRLSMRNAILSGSILGLSIGLIHIVVLGLTFGLSSVERVGLSDGLRLGGSIGLIGALWYSGFDIIQHYILRLILIIQGHTPANYVRFLDYAVDRIFLHKVGGGYRFIHRLLLEHFADMGETIKKV